jgi:hypothetical protein
MNTDQRAYSSIFLDDDWAHQKYLGWKLIESRAGLRLLCRRQFLFSRKLIFLTRGGEDRLAGYLAANRAVGRFEDVTIHDFDNVLSEPPEFGDWRFRPANSRERLLNIATFVIDLSLDEESIIRAMSSDYRRKIRKAPNLGVTVEAHDRPSPALQAAFVGAFKAFARPRRLKPIDPKALEAMYAGGDGILFVASRQGSICSYLHVYKTKETGMFMHGVNPSKDNDGAGQFLHWCAIRRLKAMGLRWYDFGGVATKDPSDGIYNFKVKFGGRLMDLGCEWRGESFLAALIRRMRDAVSR